MRPQPVFTQTCNPSHIPLHSSQWAKFLVPTSSPAHWCFHSLDHPPNKTPNSMDDSLPQIPTLLPNPPGECQGIDITSEFHKMYPTIRSTNTSKTNFILPSQSSIPLTTLPKSVMPTWTSIQLFCSGYLRRCRLTLSDWLQEVLRGAWGPIVVWMDFPFWIVAAEAPDPRCKETKDIPPEVVTSRDTNGG